jgi:chromosome segregation ATPase
MVAKHVSSGEETSELSLAVANRENLEREIASLEEALAEAVEETANAQRALDDLEGRRNEAAGRLEIARQATESYEARLDDRREALARAFEAELHARVLETAGERDDAARRAAEAIAYLVASFERLDAARASTAKRIAELEAHAGRRVEVDPEPAELDEQWVQLVDFVTTRAQLRLDEELVEAAASSPGGHDIEKLPEHLQVVAERRRNERMRAASRAYRKRRKSSPS